MNTSLLEGSMVMAIGMGTVLTFLCLTILAMTVMSTVVGYLNKIFPEAVVETAGAKVRKSSSNDEEIAAAIVAALFKK